MRAKVNRSLRCITALLSALLATALLSSATAAASWPGANGPLVFAAGAIGPEGEGEARKGIWSSSLSAPAEQIKKLTRNPSDTDPAVSSDGRLIAFSSGVPPEAGGFPSRRAIFLMQADGGGLRQLTAGNQIDEDPAFTRSGRALLFSRVAAGREDRDIYSVALDGSHLTQITHGPGSDIEAVASPRAGLIAFTRAEAGDGIHSHLFIARIDGTRARDLTPRTKRNEAALAPDFRPDGHRIAFQRYPQGAVFEMRPDGSGQRQVTGVRRPNSEAGFEAPVYSPDGKTIAALQSDRHGGSTLYLFDPETRKQLPCLALHTHQPVSEVAWAPARHARPLSAQCRR